MIDTLFHGPMRLEAGGWRHGSHSTKCVTSWFFFQYRQCRLLSLMKIDQVTKFFSFSLPLSRLTGYVVGTKKMIVVKKRGWQVHGKVVGHEKG